MSIIKYYLILILGILTYSCSIKPSNVKATEPIKEWRDTMLYPALRYESKGVEINYTLYQKYDLEEEYEIKIRHNISDDCGLETIEIVEKDIFIKMKEPCKSEIKLDFITKKKKAAQLDLFLFPCTEADYRRITGMPEIHRHYIKNGDSVKVEIQSYHSIGDTSKYGGTLRRDGNTITYTPNKEFVGLDEFGYWGKQIFSKCGGHWDTGHLHYVFVLPKDSLNKKPIARNDTIDYDSQKYSCTKCLGYEIYPLRNDYDSDISLKEYRGLGLKIDSISQPLNGYAKIESSNSIRYKSIDNSKNDEIEYVISDINGLKAKAIIYIIKE